MIPKKNFRIGQTKIGEGCSTFVVAELSGNHLQKYDLAVKTIKAIAKTGADAVKIQTFKASTLTLNSDHPSFLIKDGTIWDGKYMFKIFQTAFTPWKWQSKLKRLAEKLGLVFFSSPFDHSAVDFLAKMDVLAYKVASPEIVDLPLIRYIAEKRKPMMISTGIANKRDIKEAVNTCLEAGNNNLALLKCTSLYPAPMDEVNLRSIPILKRDFKTIVGISDHTLGETVAIGAVALGAKIVEKHIILDRKLGGPDAAFSMEPDEFTHMVSAIRDIDIALGKSSYKLSSRIKVSRRFRRSLFITKNIKTGEKFTKLNLRSIRPGNGLPPKYLDQILGKSARRNIKAGTPLRWTMVQYD